MIVYRILCEFHCILIDISKSLLIIARLEKPVFGLTSFNWLFQLDFYSLTNSDIFYMPTVKVKDNEPFDYALRRFKRAGEKAGTLTETRRRQHYEKPTSVRKRKAAAAVKRNFKRLSKEVGNRRRYY